MRRILHRIHKLLLVDQLIVLWAVELVLFISIVYFVIDSLIDFALYIWQQHSYTHFVQAPVWLGFVLLFRFAVVQIRKYALLLFDWLHWWAFDIQILCQRSDIVAFVSHFFPPFLDQLQIWFSWSWHLLGSLLSRRRLRQLSLLHQFLLIPMLAYRIILTLPCLHRRFLPLLSILANILLHKPLQLPFNCIDLLLRQMKILFHFVRYLLWVVTFNIIFEIYFVFLVA